MAAREVGVTRDSGGVIRTPDRRLRVFVSSTISELGEERAATSAAIESLRLHPVLFEAGARPHPPREVYRAYLEQSDIFVGIYWQSAGWVAPGMEVSGLEDEFRLSNGMPRLIYVKEPAPDREPRLGDLLDHISRSGISFRRFGDAQELAEVVKEDLALLLTERFVSVQDEPAPPPTETEQRFLDLPGAVEELVGRDADMEQLEELLLSDDVPLVTLTGPGGIGKSRLALETARRVQDRFEDGAYLVPLEAITDPTLVLPTMLNSIGIQEVAGLSPLKTLVEHLKDKHTLLLIDNFEQVVQAAADVTPLIERCPRLHLLITSRIHLNLRAEHEYPVPPLTVPHENETELDTLAAIPAVQLFVSRAAKINLAFELNAENAGTVAEICKRLDGLPLAIELAASRTRVLPPASILQRLDRRLSLLTTGDRDLPERHHTLRSAIEWSYDLLQEDQRTLFVRCGAFRGGWTLEAVEAVCDPERTLDVLDGMEILVESSLVRQTATSGEPRFSMFETVREYAAGRLAEDPEREAIEVRATTFFLDMLREAYDALRGPSQTEWINKIEADYDNVRGALQKSFRRGLLDEVAEAGWSLWLFWWIRDHLAEGRRWMEALLERSEDLTPLARARAMSVGGVLMFWQADYGPAMPLFLQALETFRSLDDDNGVALCQLPLALMQAGLGQPEEAMPRYRESLDLFEKTADHWGRSITINAMCWIATGLGLEDVPDDMFEEGVEAARRAGTDQEMGMALANLGRRRAFRGDLDEGEHYLRQALSLLAERSYRGPATTQMESLADIALLRGHHEKAARLYGAAAEIRSQVGSPLNEPFASLLNARVEGLRKEMGEEAFRAERDEGAKLGFEEAVALALSP